MKIKKKELRKRQAQLPINYPDPEVLPDALPGGIIDLDAEMVRVELLCKRLAHNEVVVRDAVLAELPRYLQRVTKSIAELETSYVDEIRAVQAYFAAHPKTHNPYHYDNIPVALQLYHDKVQQHDAKERRKAALDALRRRREQEKREKEMRGRFGPAADLGSDEEDTDEGTSPANESHNTTSNNEHKILYAAWMEQWSDLELLFLKLCRGIFFCLWHSDKPLVQLECAQRIANLLHAPLTTRSKILFYGALFRVLSREWPTIDRYRMDKYLALVRKMLFALVQLIKEHGENRETNEAAAAAKKAQTHPGGDSTSAGGVGTGKAKEDRAPRATGKKRRRSGVAEDEEAAAPSEKTAGGAQSGNEATALTVRSIPDSYINTYLGAKPELCSVVREVFYIMQEHIFPCTTSVGLTMHLCDVAFDELCHAQLPTSLFLVLSVGLPLYAMSQGNYVEKRVLDNFFPPIAGGVLLARRTELITAEQRKALVKSGKKASRSREEIAAEAQILAQRDTSAILVALSQACQQFAVCRGTVRAVRVMFSEAELVLQQAADPEAYQTLTHTAQRRRIEKELDEIDDTRRVVRSERQAVREAKVEEKKKALVKKIKERKAAVKARNGKEEVDDKAIRREVLQEEKSKKKKKVVRNTKRKKDYVLTKQDLFGEPVETRR